MQPVAWAMMASLPMALQAQRTARASPQPWQDRCPEVKNSSRGIMREAYVSNFRAFRVSKFFHQPLTP